MKTTIQKILEGQSWLSVVTDYPLAKKAVQLVFSRFPRAIKKELKASAAAGKVDLWDLVACNLSYEISIISQFADELDTSSILSGLSKAKAKPVGCTSLAVIEDCGTGMMNDSVWFGRNLDWQDSNGALQENVRTEFKPTKFGTEYETVTFPGMSGVLTGLSPGRFAVSLNAALAGGSSSVNLMAPAPTFLLREVLEKCESSGQAIKILSESPVMTSVIFTVVSAEAFGDPESAAVVIERTPTAFAIRKAEHVVDDTWMVVATNTMHGIPSEDLEGLSDSSCWREEAVAEGVAEGKSAEEILEAVEFGITIYRSHGDIVNSDTLTTR
jgi:hypothetical protein